MADGKDPVIEEFVDEELPDLDTDELEEQEPSEDTDDTEEDAETEEEAEESDDTEESEDTKEPDEPEDDTQETDEKPSGEEEAEAKPEPEPEPKAQEKEPKPHQVDKGLQKTQQQLAELKRNTADQLNKLTELVKKVVEKGGPETAPSESDTEAQQDQDKQDAEDLLDSLKDLDEDDNVRASEIRSIVEKLSERVKTPDIKKQVLEALDEQAKAQRASEAQKQEDGQNFITELRESYPHIQSDEQAQELIGKALDKVDGEFDYLDNAAKNKVFTERILPEVMQEAADKADQEQEGVEPEPEPKAEPKPKKQKPADKKPPKSTKGASTKPASAKPQTPPESGFLDDDDGIPDLELP